MGGTPVTPQKRSRLQAEYKRIQEDLDAFLNRPFKLRVTRHYVETVKWLESRLSALEQQLSMS